MADNDLKVIVKAKLVADGKLSMERFQASYNAWKNHISHGNCKKLSLSMDKRINEILNGRDKHAD